MIGSNLPISEYYRENLLDIKTISNTGTWWTAVLAIKDPKTEKPFIAFYRWQKRHGEWKCSSSFKIRTSKQLKEIVNVAQEFSPHLES